MSAPLSILGGSARAWLATTPHHGIEDEFELHWGGKFRKIGRFIKLALTGAALAMKDAGLTALPARRTGVFLGTGLGNLADLIPFVHSLYDGQSIPSPTQFASSLGNSGAFYIAQAYGLEGPVLAICQDEVSFEAAVLNASALLQAEEIDFALVGGVDVFVEPVTEQLARLGHDPLDGSIPLGEGAGFWLLSREAGGRAQLLQASMRQAEAVLPQGPHTLFLNDALKARLAPGPEATLAAALPGTFPTQSAVAAGAFVAGSAAPAHPESSRGKIFHSLSVTREGLIGALTVRRLA